MQWLFDVIRHHPGTLVENIEDRLARGSYKEIDDGVFAAPGASLAEYVVVDSRQGPIVLDENVRQSGDTVYRDMLGRLRMGDPTAEDIERMNACVGKDVSRNGVTSTKLYSKNVDVDKQNEDALDDLAAILDRVAAWTDRGDSEVLTMAELADRTRADG